VDGRQATRTWRKRAAVVRWERGRHCRFCDSDRLYAVRNLSTSCGSPSNRSGSLILFCGRTLHRFAGMSLPKRFVYILTNNVRPCLVLHRAYVGRRRTAALAQRGPMSTYVHRSAVARRRRRGVRG
jgi:hypothetical protein